MKHALRFVLVLCGMAASLYAQPDWTVVPQDPSTIMWNGVSFTDENHGTVVGFEGHVWTTFNGCVTWSKTSFGTNNSMLCVRYLNANAGYTGGQNGTLAKTTDGGVTWTPVGFGATFAVNDVYFHNDNQGIIVGQSGNIRLTTDGGNSWTPATSNFGGNNVYSVAFPSPTVGYIVGNAGKISKTTNGGANWTSQGSGTSINMYGVSFGSVSVGAAVGTDGKILYTTNGGANWLNANVNAPISSVVLRAIQFVDANEAYCVGWQGYILRSINGGKDWTVLAPPTTVSLEALSFTSKTFGYVVGWDGHILRTKKPGELSAPQLLQPANGAINVALPVNLTWSAVSGAASYTVQVAKDAVFSTTVIDQSGISGSPYVASGLDENETYYWRVHASNAQGTGPWSDVWSFTTAGSLPAAPVLLSPANDTLRAPLDPNLLWAPVSGSVTYGLQVASDAAFTSLVRNETSISETRYPLSGLSRSMRYYWRVNATNSLGAGPWSAVWSFSTVGAAPAAPELLHPADDSTGLPTSGTVAWAATDNAESYHVQIATSTAFTSVVFERSALTSLSWEYSGLAPGTDYYWRVRASNVEGAGPWSAVWKFRTAGGAPAAPVLLAPANNSTNVPISGNLLWNPVTGATAYRVQLALADDFAAPIIDSTGIAATACAYAGLQRSAKYFWRVRALNTEAPGPWSAVWNFTTQGEPLAAPMLVSPANDTTDIMLVGTLRWTLVSRAITYHTQISIAPDFSSIAIDSAGISGTSTSYRGLLPATRYYWRVRAANSSGPGLWSDVWSFTTIGSTLAAPVLISPAKDTTGVLIDGMLIWNAVSEADSYSVQLSASADFVSKITDTSGLAATSLAYEGLEREARYWWRVRASNDEGDGPWSAVWSFVTELALPPAPGLLNPPNRADDVPVSGTFRWLSTPNTTEYHLQLSRAPDFSSTVIDTTGILGTQKAYAGLAKDTLYYYWRVRAINGTLVGPWSEVWSFRTEKPPTVGLQEIMPLPLMDLAAWPSPGNGGNISIEVTTQLRGRLTVQIVDSRGAVVERLFDGESGPGALHLAWRAAPWRSGVFFVSAQAHNVSTFRKLVITR